MISLVLSTVLLLADVVVDVSCSTFTITSSVTTSLPALTVDLVVNGLLTFLGLHYRYLFLGFL